jgi:BolA protein
MPFYYLGAYNSFCRRKEKRHNGKMSKKNRIETALKDRFEVIELIVIDESEMHRGHAGYQEGGESHYRVTLRSPDFQGMSRIARHRAVHEALGKELVAEIHALALNLDIE